MGCAQDEAADRPAEPVGVATGLEPLQGGLRAAAAGVGWGGRASDSPKPADCELPDPEEERTQETLIAARHALWQHSFHRIKRWLLSSEVRPPSPEANSRTPAGTISGMTGPRETWNLNTGAITL